MAKKINQKLLNEELKRFRLISEYTFYTEEPKNDDDLILGSGIDEADDTDQDDPTATANPADDSKTAVNQGTPAAPTDPNAPVDPAAQPPVGGAAVGPDASQDNAMLGMGGNPETPPADTGGGMGNMGDLGDESSADDVEVDVTQLVKGSEEAKESADNASHKTSVLLNKFNDLERRVAAMDSISGKIETLEKEIIKRNPTPIEKLEMRSLDSYPFNIKLKDYWKDVDGYDATSDNKEEEYTLTKDDVDTGFTDAGIKSTFNVPKDWEEEDVYN